MPPVEVIRGPGQQRSPCEQPVQGLSPWGESAPTFSLRHPPAVQLSPPTLNVSQAGDGYVLSWEAQKPRFDHIGHTFQVQYKKDSASWLVSTCWGRGRG